MLNHGLSTAALVRHGRISDQAPRIARHQRLRRGADRVAPVLAGLLLFAGLSTLSLPGLSSFVSEFMVLAGTFSRHPAYAVISTLAIVLAALYILIMYQRTMTGPVPPEVAGEGHRAQWSGAARHGAAGPADPRCSASSRSPCCRSSSRRPQATMQHVGVTDPQPRVSAEGGR